MDIRMLDVELEGIIDRNTVFQVIEALARVCEEKAAYVAEGGSHGDPSPHMARQWRNVAKSLSVVSGRAAGL